MPAGIRLRASARALGWVLTLAATAVFALGSVTSAQANGGLSACSTINGSDGHPYHWSAPC